MPQTFFGWVVYLLLQYGSVLLKGAVGTLLLDVVAHLSVVLSALLSVLSKQFLWRIMTARLRELWCAVCSAY